MGTTAGVQNAEGSTAPSSRLSSQEPQARQSSPVAQSGDQMTEPAAKRRSRERQPTQRAIEAGLAPALAGHQGQSSHRSSVDLLQGAQHAQHAQHAQQAFGPQSSQHLQAGMPVQ